MAFNSGSTYSFLDVSATIAGLGGTVSIGAGSGSAEEGITVAMTDDKGNLVMGSDGSWMHNLRASRSGVITARILKTSPTNQLLSVMYDLQSVSSQGWGKNVILVSNSVSGDAVTGLGCAFRKWPDFANARDGAMVEWAWLAGRIDGLLGSYPTGYAS